MDASRFLKSMKDGSESSCGTLDKEKKKATEKTQLIAAFFSVVGSRERPHLSAAEPGPLSFHFMAVMLDFLNRIIDGFVCIFIRKLVHNGFEFLKQCAQTNVQGTGDLP